MVRTSMDYSSRYLSTYDMNAKLMHETASRSGGLCTWDRRGRVVWYDNFESAVSKWDPAIDGTLTLTTAETYLGSQSMRMIVNAGVGTNLNLIHGFELPNTKLIGFEFAMQPPTDDAYVIIYAYIDNGVRACQFNTMWDNVTNIVYYRPSVGPYVQVLPLKNLETLHRTWHHFKLVVHSDAAEYERLIINSTEFDLSGFVPPNAGAAGAPYVRLYITLQNRGAVATPTMYVDNAVYTIDEPVNE
jgi:hypothetical protein